VDKFLDLGIVDAVETKAEKMETATAEARLPSEVPNAPSHPYPLARSRHDHPSIFKLIHEPHKLWQMLPSWSAHQKPEIASSGRLV
jgi:hypothetical protein